MNDSDRYFHEVTRRLAMDQFRAGELQVAITENWDWAERAERASEIDQYGALGELLKTLDRAFYLLPQHVQHAFDHVLENVDRAASEQARKQVGL